MIARRIHLARVAGALIGMILCMLALAERRMAVANLANGTTLALSQAEH
jgi:putative effector of murein hydrolase LrgA (UPF0299 family)